MENFSWLSDQSSRILIDHLQDGIFVIEDRKFVYVNQQLANMIGYQANELIGRTFIDLITIEDQPLVQERYRARLSGHNVPSQYDIHFLTAQGQLIFCSLNIGLWKNEKGRISIIGSARDVTRQKSELAELEASKTELKSIFDQLHEVLYRTNMQGIITLISPSCFDVLGYRQEVMLGTPMVNYYKTPADRQIIVQAIIDGDGKITRVEAGMKHKDGSTVWISTNAVIRFDSEGKPSYIEGVARDISERKRMEDQLVMLTRIDDLTGVYNRRYFMSKCDEILKVMRRYKHPASMLMMDLDHFKKINDHHGHHIGDQALIAFAKACQIEIRDSDILGRLGGEEYGLMLPETTIQNAEALAERIRQNTAAIEIRVRDQIIGITVSIGLVELSTEAQTLDDALRRADQAMYQAKERGRNQVVTSLKTE